MTMKAKVNRQTKTKINSRNATKNKKQERKASPARPKPAGNPAASSKKNTLITLLRQHEGETLTVLAEASGWKPNSVRGFLHGPTLKRMGLKLQSTKPDSGDRRYSVAGGVSHDKG